MPQSFYLIALGVFGSIFGSFANVVIWRLPRGESLSTPGSHCPGCDSPIRWHDNIPLASWLVLRGRCRDCGRPISIRYPLVEAASALLWVLAGVVFGMTARAAVAVVFFYLLLLLAMIDLDVMRLPNVLVLWLAGAGLAAVIASQLLAVHAAPLVGIGRSGFFANPAVAAIGGALLGAGVSGGIAALWGAFRGRAGMGAGDVKLLAAMGLFLGPYVLLALFIGSFVGALAGIGVLKSDGGDAAATKIPFGPSLALGGILAALAGPALIAWYAGLVSL